MIRKFTDPPLERIPVPIVAGINRGRRWNLASAGSGYGSGRRASAQMQLLVACMLPGDVVWDVGAHHGYVTLAASARVGSAGWVHAFEPGAANRRLLERHVRWNGLRNASVHGIALSSFTGTARFGGGDTSKMHALGGGDEEVAVHAGAALVRDGTLRAPSFLKIDVEGAEADVLAGAMDAIPPHARLVIAMHSAAADRDCCALLETFGYRLYPSPALRQSRRGTWHGDPDLIAVGPESRHAAAVESALAQHQF